MPLPFRPSVARGLARGLRVVEGESSALARAKALRARTGNLAPFARELDVYAEGSEPRTFRRRGAGPVFSPEATAEQAMRAEALKRHAGPVFSPWATAEQAMRAEALKRHAGPVFSPWATAEQAMRAEALKRHAGPVEDPRTWARRLTAKQAAAETQKRHTGAVEEWQDADILDAFERKYGWRPPSADEARSLLSPNALDELLGGDFHPPGEGD